MNEYLTQAARPIINDDEVELVPVMHYTTVLSTAGRVHACTNGMVAMRAARDACLFR